MAQPAASEKAAGGRIRREDRDGVAVLLLDHPERSMNVVDEELLAELREQVEAIAADDTVIAAVLTSGKPGSFGAGADVTWLPELAAKPDAEQYLASVHDLMYEMTTSPRPWVAALNGSAFGGALELALATEAIVAVPNASVGLPEIGLGLLPGGAGTQLIRRWLSTDDALELLLGGKPLTASAARSLGLVTAIAGPDELLDVAVETAKSLAAGTQRRGQSVDSAGDALAALAAREAAQPAAASEASRRILEVVRAGVEGGALAGTAAERTAFLALLGSREAKARMHLFTVEGEIKRRSKGNGETFDLLGVVGGGQMGSGIAATAVSRGLSAIVRDVTDEQLAGSKNYLTKVLTRVAPDAVKAAALAEHWSGTTEWVGFDRADAVVEAVFELPDLKRETLSKVSAEVSATTLIATNTSAIPVHSIAAAVTSPERFLGMHFFSPVDRMPLVELVPHVGTSADTVIRASSLARQLGKTPVVVADKPGFFTSRVYARWLIEGTRLLLDGVKPELIDSAAKAAGFPVGPLQAHDEATLDLVVKASITQVAEKVMADRIDVAAVRATLEKLIAAGVQGKRQGKGFYLYKDGRRDGINPEVVELIGAGTSRLTSDQVGERLLLAFATECYLCWDDGTLCHPDDGDVASVLGIGFPRVLGGPFHWTDESGIAKVVKRCQALGTDAFPTGTTLVELGTSGGLFAAETRRPAPASSVASAGSVASAAASA
jgi:3-hydroxyacyl-CoA dehydrogenase/enoyl-CoA hydratase/3-hydroxybutyryl-CoA epimerase